MAVVVGLFHLLLVAAFALTISLNLFWGASWSTFGFSTGMAGPAAAASVRQDVKVGTGELVPARASSIGGDRSSHVLGVRDCFQVIGVDAVRDSAEVVGLEAGWHRSLRLFVGDDVS